jgi:hypothetical protein
MSNVTNMILTTRPEDRDNAYALNTLVAFRGEIGLVPCDNPEWAGGNAPLTMNICVGSCGEVDLVALVHAMRQTRWIHPERVQLFVCTHDDIAFVELDWPRTTELPADDRVPM